MAMYLSISLHVLSLYAIQTYSSERQRPHQNEKTINRTSASVFLRSSLISSISLSLADNLSAVPDNSSLVSASCAVMVSLCELSCSDAQKVSE